LLLDTIGPITHITELSEAYFREAQTVACLTLEAVLIPKIIG